ncbi:MAG: hypothetical protein H7124_16095 [Phycisphaerales bacterium]|nr:hypothetical protein [Hyphomonadaceae bacterium]
MLIRALVFDVSPLLAKSLAKVPNDLVENALLRAADDLAPRLIEASVASVASDDTRGIVLVLNVNDAAAAARAVESHRNVE